MTTEETRAARAELSRLAAGMGALRRRLEQLAALKGDEGDTAIARLERVLRFDDVVAHVRGAVNRAPLAGEPVPHLLVTDLLPLDAYRALIEAIPDEVFFDGRLEKGHELRVPPRLAPMSSIVAWRFLDEVARILSGLLLARLGEPLAAYTRARFPSVSPFRDWQVEITLTEGRLVRRAPGFSGRHGDDGRQWDLVTGVLHLARDVDAAEYGSRLQGMLVPFRPNAVLAFVGPADAHAYEPIPADAPAAVERHTYEFGVGPTREGRRALLAQTTVNGGDASDRKTDRVGG